MNSVTSPIWPVEIRSLTANVDLSLLAVRLISSMFAAFAGFALILAVGGIYGTTAYVVTQRRHELGVRLALGADPKMLVASVLRRGVRVTVVGLVLGLLGAWALSEVLASLVFGISARDPTTFVAVTLLLGTSATVAMYVPARAAAEVDPRETLVSG